MIWRDNTVEISSFGAENCLINKLEYSVYKFYDVLNFTLEKFIT